MINYTIKKYFIIIYLICVSQLIGQITFAESFAGTLLDADNIGRKVLQTNDFAYVVAGEADNYHKYGSSEYAGNAFILKTNIFGEIEWKKEFNTSDRTQGAYSVVETMDKGFLLCAYNTTAESSRLWLIKTDSNGDSLWSKPYEILGKGKFIEELDDSSLVVLGGVIGDRASIYLLKINSQGDSLWTKEIYDPYGGNVYSLAKTSDDGFIIGSTKYIPELEESGVWIIKTDSTGDTLWTQTIVYENFERPHYIFETEAKEYIVFGMYYEYEYLGLVSHMFMLKLDVNGELIWEKKYSHESRGDYIYASTSTSDGNFVTICNRYNYSEYGRAYVDILFQKINGDGEIIFEKIINNSSFQDEYSKVDAYKIQTQYIKETKDEGFILTGNRQVDDYNVSDIFLIKLDKNGELVTYTPNQAPGFLLYPNYPNPFNNSTKISFEVFDSIDCVISIYNIKGERTITLADKVFERGLHTLNWNGNNALGREMPSGVYIIQIKSGGFDQTQKIVLIK
jgi:hypothetical protein